MGFVKSRCSQQCHCPLSAVTLTLWWAAPAAQPGAHPALLREGDGSIFLPRETHQQMGKMNGISHSKQKALMSRVFLFAQA